MIIFSYGYFSLGSISEKAVGEIERPSLRYWHYQDSIKIKFYGCFSIKGTSINSKLAVPEGTPALGSRESRFSLLTAHRRGTAPVLGSIVGKILYSFHG